MKRIWIHKARSFKQAQEFEARYYSRMSAAGRLETVQFLRDQYFKLHPGLIRECRKRLRRSIRIIKQK